MVCDILFWRVGPKTLNDPSPIRLLLFGMERRVMSRLDHGPSLDGIWVAMQPFRQTGDKWGYGKQCEKGLKPHGCISTVSLELSKRVPTDWVCGVLLHCSAHWPFQKELPCQFSTTTQTASSIQYKPCCDFVFRGYLLQTSMVDVSEPTLLPAPGTQCAVMPPSHGCGKKYMCNEIKLYELIVNKTNKNSE